MCECIRMEYDEWLDTALPAHNLNDGLYYIHNVLAHRFCQAFPLKLEFERFDLCVIWSCFAQLFIGAVSKSFRHRSLPTACQPHTNHNVFLPMLRSLFDQLR